MTGALSAKFALAIEASNPSATRDGGAGGSLGVAVARIREIGDRFEVDGSVEVEALRTGSVHEDDLMPAIERVTQRAGARPGDIALVIVSVGPGGFTALRVAVTVAKTICLSTGAKCAAVPSALVIAAGAESVPAPFAVLLAGKGDSSFATVFELSVAGRSLNVDGAREARREGRLVLAADLAGLGIRTIVSDRFLPKAIALEAEKLGITVVPPVFGAEACLRVGLLVGQTTPEALTPLYPREPEAVTKWRALHPDP